MLNEFEKWEQGRKFPSNVYDNILCDLVCQCASPELATEIVREHNSVEALRKRIHQIEQHNQWFERCESGWCNPSTDCDPAIGVFLKPFEVSATPQRGKDGGNSGKV